MLRNHSLDSPILKTREDRRCRPWRGLPPLPDEMDFGNPAAPIEKFEQRVIAVASADEANLGPMENMPTARLAGELLLKRSTVGVF